MEEVKAEDNQTENQEVKRGPGRPPKIQAEQVTNDVPTSLPEQVQKSVVNEPEQITDPCWNCGKQLKFGKCEVCGFDKDLIRNPDLDSKREALRRKVINQ